MSETYPETLTTPRGRVLKRTSLTHTADGVSAAYEGPMIQMERGKLSGPISVSCSAHVGVFVGTRLFRHPSQTVAEALRDVDDCADQLLEALRPAARVTQ